MAQDRRGDYGAGRAAARTLGIDVLTLHLVLGAALAGRTTPDHAYRAARRAAESARVAAFGAVCATCGDPLPETHRWAIWGDDLVKVTAPGHPLFDGRCYCRVHCAERAWASVPTRHNGDRFKVVEVTE